MRYFFVLHANKDVFSENIGTKMRKKRRKGEKSKKETVKIFTRKATYELEKAK